MAKYLRDYGTLVHYWANQIQSEGRYANMLFEGLKIYSYGKHFCMARLLPRHKAVLITRRTHGPTTSGHQSQVRHAVSHLERIYIRDADDSVHTNMQAARGQIADLLFEASKPRKRQHTKDELKKEALEVARNANRMLELLTLEGEVTFQIDPIDTSNLEAMVADMMEERRVADEREKAAQKEYARIRAEREAQRMNELRAALVDWRNHRTLIRTGLYELPPALRLSQDGKRIETTRGAEIPVQGVDLMWNIVVACRAEGQAREFRNFKVGVYTLNLVKGDGTIVVGCHTIAYEELEGIAIQLGFINEPLPL